MNVLHPPAVPIAAVERDTGLSKDTLRVWERRYGFPTPLRDENGERLYPYEQVERLRLLRRLTDQGLRPAKIIHASREELSRLLEDCQSARPPKNDTQSAQRIADFIALIKLHRLHELRAALQQALIREGLRGFVGGLLEPLNRAVGDAWVQGELGISEEHLYTEQVQNVLRSAINSHAGVAPPGQRPRVLLTTVPDELHALGLLMAEAILVSEGACCTSLGTQTPIADIASAAIDHSFDIVALSYSGAFPLRQALDTLQDLRRRLPAGIAIWAGGEALNPQRVKIPGVQALAGLDELPAAIAAWRRAQQALHSS